VTSAPLRRSSAWTIAALATLAMSVSYIDRQVLAALAQSVKESLDIGYEQFGWLASAFSMAYLVGTPLAGVLVDRIGARRGLVASMIVWSAVAAGHAAASSFAMLFALRIALGAAESPSFPAAAQSVRRALEPRDRAAGFGLLFTGSSIGAMIAPPLAVAMKTQLGGWRPAFVVTAIIGLVWIPAWHFATRSPAARAALDRHVASNDGPAPSRAELLANPAVLRALLLVCSAAPTVMLVLIWAPQYLEKAFHLTENDVAKYVWLPPLAFDAGAVVFGSLATRRDRRFDDGAVRSHADLTLGAAVLCSALALCPFARSPWEAVALCSVALAGGGALFARLTGDMLARVPAAHASTAAGLTAAAQSLVYVVGNPIVGKIVQKTGSFNVALVAIGALAIPGGIAWALIPVREKRA
jgi:ACS family hexuronate transporter-like MFS transporter